MNYDLCKSKMKSSLGSAREPGRNQSFGSAREPGKN